MPACLCGLSEACVVAKITNSSSAGSNRSVLFSVS